MNEQIKKGDKLLIQVIAKNVVLEQHVSYCYERKGFLCYYWRGFVNTIEESKGATFTVLDEVKDKELIKDNIRKRDRGGINLPSWGSGHKYYINAWTFDNGGKFTEELNSEFSRLSVPKYKTQLI